VNPEVKVVIDTTYLGIEFRQLERTLDRIADALEKIEGHLNVEYVLPVDKPAA
jgi:hypothetical protein